MQGRTQSRLETARMNGRQSVSQRLRNINLKILVLALGLSLIVVMTTVVVSLQLSVTEAYEIKSRGLASYVAPALVFDDRPAAQAYLDALGESPGVISATVTRGDGEVFARYERPLTNPGDKEPAWLPVIEVQDAVAYRGSELGTISMQVSLLPVYRDALAITAVILLASVLVLLLVALNLGKLNASIVNPLQHLDNVMQRVARSGDYAQRAPESDIEEIHRVSVQFNELLGQISAREAKIEQLANFDLLTGLYNRRGLTTRVEYMLRQAEKQDQKPALVFLDLDNFKAINDTLGHDVGDQVLAEVGQRIARTARGGITVGAHSRPALQLGRLGGDEFLLLLPDLPHQDTVIELADRIRETICEPIQAGGNSVHITASIGIACYPRDGHSAAQLIQHADSAMYFAKQQGRDQCRFYDPELTRQMSFRMRIVDQMRDAITANEFRLAYQPLIDARDGRIRSAEALLRWDCPNEPNMHPGIFIPIAESSGLIMPLGRWILQTACHDAVRMGRLAGHPIRIAVNISPAQIFARGFVDLVRECLDEAGLDPTLLELEITEDVVIERYQAAHDPLTELAEIGVQIALDDFGTGYSSLSYLKRLPIGRLKIDRSFVDGLPHDADDLAIVTAVTALARALGLQITAEGVETEEQAALLKQKGCDVLQGYLYSPAVPEADFLQLVARADQAARPLGSQAPSATPLRSSNVS
jgi:diguanylate cyclase (GGDEF)-like protein